MPHTRVRRARFVRRDDELRTRVLRGYGFVAECGCGWSAAVRQSYAEARADALEHRAVEHPTHPRETDEGA